jgi:hypothetical protein
MFIWYIMLLNINNNNNNKIRKEEDKKEVTTPAGSGYKSLIRVDFGKRKLHVNGYYFFS